MSFRDFPDPEIPPTELRCEAMTKATPTYQDWRRLPHRCIRRSTQSRAGHAVCALHARLDYVSYWDGVTPDAFPSRKLRRKKP